MDNHDSFINTFIQDDFSLSLENKFDRHKYIELMMMFNCAIKEITTKLDILNDEFSIRYKRNPIEFMKTRIKKPQSVIDKLERKNFPLTIDSVVNNLNDVAGVRVVCSFVEDIYFIADTIIKQDDITLIKVKDYIKVPKQNGYRSLHMILGIPVFFSDRKQFMKVEVQIRTIAMDFWASIEHLMKYKKNLIDCDTIGEELEECANIITNTDYRMQEIYHKILGDKSSLERKD